MTEQRSLKALVALLTLSALVGCGDDSPSTPTAPPPPPPAPSATIQTMGNGNIVIHPSIDPTFCCTTEFPIRIRETSGGTAIWNFFRVSYFLNEVEIERAEQGADAIRSAGYRDIAANSTNDVVVFIRDNATNFDDVEILLGFADTKDGRQIEQMLDMRSFSGILFNPIPAVLPEEGSTFAIVER